jgi:hypothetical protein
MAARRTRTAGLTGEDVQRLRDQLAAGRRPRVQVSGPQFDGATAATVTRVGDPAIDGTDYLTVRVKVNGVLDELAFAPAELSLRRAQSRTGRSAGTGRSPASKSPASKAPASKASTSARAATVIAPAPAAAPAPAPVAAPAAAPSPAPASSQQLPATEDGSAASPAEKPARERHSATSAARRRKPTAAPKVGFTVVSSGASWALSATRGAKGIVKNITVQPGVVTALAELLGQPALLDAVAEINQTALSEAQARAEQLRAELDQLEAVLATHRAPGNHSRR